jgi:hypothetical protein
MLGAYDNFPQTIHLIESYSTKLNIKQLQQKLIQTIKNMNRKPLHFEDIAVPTIPNSEVIFEFGLAEGDGFNFIDQEEENKVTELLKSQQLQMMDFFCAIRYYKLSEGKKIALKFDYYMIRSHFASGVVEFQIFHKQGPRYLSPQDLLSLIIERINFSSPKRILVRIESIQS